MGVTADEFAERVLAASLGAWETLSVYVGDRLGWYRSLALDGPATPAELAGRTGTSARYAREWLEQQAVIGILTVQPGLALDGHGEEVADAVLTGPDGERRRYVLPAGAAEALIDERSLAYLSPLPRMFAAAASHLPQLLEAYRSDGGVSWEDLGDDARESQADMNRPWFEGRLGEALRGVPAVHARLDRSGARMLDVGCGAGWSTIALARAYPASMLDGVDIDAPSIGMAQRNAADAGVADRVTFQVADGGTLETDVYDAAFAFECIHDMPQPVEVLAAVRRALRPDGIAIVMDEAVADKFTAPGDDLERLMYGFSLFVCLPDGLSSTPSAGTGTVMRQDALRRYAVQAGFSDVEVLPIEDFGFWRFYRLVTTPRG